MGPNFPTILNTFWTDLGGGRGWLSRLPNVLSRYWQVSPAHLNRPSQVLYRDPKFFCVHAALVTPCVLNITMIGHYYETHMTSVQAWSHIC